MWIVCLAASPRGPWLVPVIDRRAKKPVKVGRVSVLVVAHKATALRVKLTAKAAKALRKAKSLRVVLRGFARDRMSRRIDLTRVVLVRR